MKDIDITHAELALVADITYIKTDQGHAYLALVTAPYSKKIMGYAIQDNMKVAMVKNAALPKKYDTIDLFKTYKYVVQDGSTEPYLRHKNIRKDTMSYNKTLQQIPILDAVQFDYRYK